MTNGQVLDFNNARKQGESSKNGVDVDDIKDRLNGNVRAFIDWLFSGRAYYTKTDARIGNVYGEQGSSLRVNLSTGGWEDYATGEHGDLIALYRAWRGYTANSDFILSLKEIARDFLGDPIEVERPTWKPSPAIQLEERKAKLGTKPREENILLGAPVATYKYYDLRGNILASVVRYEPDGTRESKTFRPWCFKEEDGKKKWIMAAPETRPLYRLPDIASSPEVVLCEGEGKAESLISIGIMATSAMQGAKAPVEKTDWSILAGKTVVIWPDNDKPGFEYAERVTPLLLSLGCTVHTVTPPEGAFEGWDAFDCIAENGNPHKLLEAAKANKAPPPKPLILSASVFVAGFRPPAYLIDGFVQQSYLYSLTARTGHGKTAVGMYMAQAVARGIPFHGRATKGGSVLYLAGENPDDVRARFLVLADHHKFNPADVPIHFVDGIIDIAACLPRIYEEAKQIPDLSLVIVDTAAAYFRGDDGNSNTQQGEYARMLRKLTFLPGKPACVVPCHPVKNASKENLLPVGGGAFLNEVDGNLTLWSSAEKQTTLHWQGKFRGPEFEPVVFELKTVECDRVVDANGVVMPSVVAEPVSDSALERTEIRQEDDENLILKIIAASPRASISQIAVAAKFVSSDGKPQKSKTQRVCMRLLEDKLIEKRRGSKYQLTKKGKKEIGIDDNDD